MGDRNARMAAMQAQFEATIAKLRCEFKKQQTRQCGIAGTEANQGTTVGYLAVVACFGSSSSYRQPQQLQQHWSGDGGMPRQQQQQ